MFVDENQSFNGCLEPESLVGRQFKHGSAVFELASILKAGPDAIAYEARDTQTSQSEHVLKVYRSKLSEKELEQKEAAYRQCVEILGDGFLNGEFLRIGEWTARLQRRAFDAVSLSSHVLQAEREPPSRIDRIKEIFELCNARNFAMAVQKCDAALEDFPVDPHCLRCKGIALFGMGESRAANDVLDLCFQVHPEDAEHYVVVTQACAALGHAVWARKWAQVGAKRARDKRQVYKAWFEAEEQAEHVKLMRMCLGQLQLLEEPEPSLEELGARLKGLEERLARCEREIEAAFGLVQQRSFAEAERIAHRLIQEHPRHGPAMLLSGVLAMEREQWMAAIGHLRRAFVQLPLGDPDIPFLLGHAYLKLGKVQHAAVMHSVWQQRYTEAAAALEGGAGAESTFASACERLLLEDPAVPAQQCRGILRAYRAVSDAELEARERIEEVLRGTERLLERLGERSHGEGAR